MKWLFPPLLLMACSSEAPHQAQLSLCQQVAEHYSEVARYTSTDIRRDADWLHIELRFAVPSALGEQAGLAVCSYSSDQQQPRRIQLGGTIYDKPADIADLIALRTQWPVISHDH